MQTTIFAHRGASSLAPENTFPAFKLAYDLGTEGIETDVQLTKDNVPVLIHDENIKRTTNGSGYVKDLTFNELQKLDAGAWFSREYQGTRIASLESLLQWICGKNLFLNIELKNNKIDYPNMESIVLKMVDHYKVLNHTIFSTFNPVSISRMRKLNPNIEIAFLTSRRNKNLVNYAKSIGANAVHIRFRLLRKELVQACQQENMAIRVYTVNHGNRMLDCFHQGCDGIFTDKPLKAKNYRRLYSNKINRK